MSKYILQTDAPGLDIEYYLIKEQLLKNKYVFEHKETDLKNLANIAEKGDIPIGDILFVTKFIQGFYGIEHQNPIEIPEYLRTDEFLKRDYKIVTYDDIPTTGRYFIKDASCLKKFNATINTRFDDIKSWFEQPKSKHNTQLVLDKSHLFAISEMYDIESEYRVYVCRGQLENIACYNGDASLFPDINLINKAINLINYNEKWLKSYTLDIMIGPKGTAIIEVHNFATVGLYHTLWGSNLIYAYRDGIDYILNDNKDIRDTI